MISNRFTGCKEAWLQSVAGQKRSV